MVPGDYSSGFDNGIAPPKTGRSLASASGNATGSSTVATASPSQTGKSKNGADRASGVVASLIGFGAVFMM